VIFEENIKRLINESSNYSILGVQFEPDYEQMKKFENLEELEEVLKFIDRGK